MLHIHRILGPYSVALAAALLVSSATAQTRVVGWGGSLFDSGWSSESFTEIAAGHDHTLARRGNGEWVAWGNNGSGQSNLPAPPAAPPCGLR